MLAWLAMRAGYFMGTELNPSNDSRDIGPFLRRWIKPYLRETRWIDVVPGELPAAAAGSTEMGDDFRASISRHRAGLAAAEGAWGWKAPRTLLVLPFVHARYPLMSAIHLVRDGRDMAYSRRQAQLRDYGSTVLEGAAERAPEPERSIALWSRLNVAAACYGERLGGRYLRVRYESLCADPEAEVARVLRFMGTACDRDGASETARALVKPASSIGRWREREPGEVERLERAGAEGLAALGYL